MAQYDIPVVMRVQGGTGGRQEAPGGARGVWASPGAKKSDKRPSINYVMHFGGLGSLRSLSVCPNSNPNNFHNFHYFVLRNNVQKSLPDLTFLFLFPRN